MAALAAFWLLVAAASTAPIATAAQPRAAPLGLVAAPLEVHPDFGQLQPFDVPRTVNLRPGFRISVFAAGLGSPRQIAFSRDGVLFSANIWDGEILAHPDRDGDGVSGRSERVVFASGLWVPHSLFFDGADLYVGAHDRVLRFADADGDLIADGPPSTVISLPTYGDQITRTVLIGPDRKLYVGIGSTANANVEIDPRRGAVVRYELDGGGESIFASGLRNPVGLAFHPITGALWSTDVGADHLGEEHPQEEINILQPGAHYGWPYCYEDRLPDIQLYPTVAPQFCPQTVPPVTTFRAHTTPLGLTFYAGSQFPVEYRQRLFVALRGSSKRMVQAGYSVMAVDIGPHGDNAHVEEFATGWLLDPNKTPDQPGQNWGRPVQPVTGPDGALYVSSDTYGAIYRISYAP